MEDGDAPNIDQGPLGALAAPFIRPTYVHVSRPLIGCELVRHPSFKFVGPSTGLVLAVLRSARYTALTNVHTNGRTLDSEHRRNSALLDDPPTTWSSHPSPFVRYACLEVHGRCLTSHVDSSIGPIYTALSCKMRLTDISVFNTGLTLRTARAWKAFVNASMRSGLATGYSFFGYQGLTNPAMQVCSPYSSVLRIENSLFYRARASLISARFWAILIGKSALVRRT